MMKLYMHPVSMTSGLVRLFIAENNLGVDEKLVHLMTASTIRSVRIDQSEPPGARARGWRSAPDRKLGDPIAGRQKDVIF
jgi:hypothetical protein